MIIAYADPPYPGLAHYYNNDEVDFNRLIERLVDDYPDGWALSIHSPALKEILPMCPDGARVGAWTKPFCSFKPGVNPAYTWEPIIFMGGRKRGTDERTVKDHFACSITLKRGLVGVKPEGFCFWLFRLLGLQDGDHFVDLFPGSGAVTRAWEKYRQQKQLVLL